MLSFLRNLRNTIDYPLRQFFRWRRPGRPFQNEPKDRLFAHLPEEERKPAGATAARLLEAYHLHALHNDSPAGNYRENLFYLELLERALAAVSPRLPSAIVAADIGPSHWFYVQALYALLTWWRAPDGRRVVLTGYEIDAYRVYADLRSRFDHAQAHIRDLQGVHYRSEPFERQRPVGRGAFDVIIQLFPFVFLPDHLAWGLPRALFTPEQLLADAWASLKPGGVLVIVNQGEDEHHAQRKMLRAAGIQPATAFRHDSLLFQYDLPRFVLAACRDD